MKIMFLGLVVLMTFAGMVFADEINPEFGKYVRSSMGSNVDIISIYPDSEEAAEKLRQLRQGELRDLLAVEYRIGPSPVPISPTLITMKKFEPMASLAASANAYVRGEVTLLGYNQDMAATIATDFATSIVFAETLKNSREELRLEYSWKNADGSTGYGISFWLAIDKSSLDQGIADMAKAISSGNYRPERKSEPAERKTTGTGRPPQQIASGPGNEKLIETVQTLMANDERILRFREENKRLLGFDE